ncbi:MAG: hypothetical protein Q9226_005034, partial [Calogaya cf. arnoldii]
RPSRVIGSRPNTSNAWTGYGNIYQEQIGTRTSTASLGKIYTDAHQDSPKRRTPPESHGLHTLAGESRPRWVNPHRPQVLEEDLLQPSRLEHGHPSTHEIDTPAFRLPDTFDATDELYPQQRHETSGLDQEPHHDFLPEAGRHLPFDKIEHGLPGENLYEGAGVSHRSEPPAFLGARASWNLSHEESFPSSGPYQHSNTQDRTFELLNHAGHGDVVVKEEVPLAASRPQPTIRIRLRLFSPQNSVKGTTTATSPPSNTNNRVSDTKPQAYISDKLSIIFDPIPTQ